MSHKACGAPTVTEEDTAAVRRSTPRTSSRTSATVRARAMYRERLRLLASGCDAMELKRGIDAAVERVVEPLEAQAKPVQERERLAQIGTVSSNGDATIGAISPRR